MASTCLNISRSTVADNIENAVSYVSQALHNDSSCVDLSDQLGVFRHTEPSQSGLQEQDYPVLSDDRYGLANLHELGPIKRIPLPAELAERFAYMQANCLMGLFTCINRAWLSIDSDIFIWNYEDGSDVAYFDGLNETILSVGLVKPKPGIFQPHIVYLLCLTTPIDIVLMAVSFLQVADSTIGHQYDEMHVLPEPLFTIPTDSVHMLSIESTQNGRIFLAGKDGCLYEILYQAADGWFSRKCRKINHSQGKLSFIVPSFLNFSFADDDPLVQMSVDHSRNILYTRSERGTIQVYDLCENGEGLKRIAAVSLATTVQNASLIARSVDKSNFQKLVHIAAIDSSESTNIHLVAITHTGARLYFTVSRFGQPSSSLFSGQQVAPPITNQSPFCPEMLSLVHVRLPPGFTIHGAPQRPANVRNALFQQGFVLLLSPCAEDRDQLCVISSDNFPFQPHLTESHESLSIEGHSWAVAEVPCSVAWAQCDMEPRRHRPEPPAVVTQHLQQERKFVIINSQGTYIVIKLSPVEQLHQLLINHGADSPAVRAYFKLHQVQASATCLVLICSRSANHQQVIELATRAFFLYSGEPDFNFAPVSNTPGLPGGTGGPTASTPFQGIAPRQLSFQSPSTSVIATSTNQDLVFSNKHRALCLYLARILRPIWETRMVRSVQSHHKSETTINLLSQFSGEHLQWLLHKLNNLQDFVNSSSLLTGCVDKLRLTGSNVRTVDDQLRRQCQLDVEAEENKSLKQLQLLINVGCEYLGLWKILSDHQFHVIASGLSQDQQASLSALTFQQLLVSGREVCQLLIKQLIAMYISDSAATDAVSERLRQICPSLYSCADEIYSKACEKLNAAKKSMNTIEKHRLILDALENYKQIADQLDLPTVCSQLAAVRYYRGIVDLVLTAAPRRDPQNLALHYYSNGKASTDIQGLQAYNLRMDCYKSIIETLDYLLSVGQQQSPSLPRCPGPPPVHNAGRLSGSDAEQYAEEVYTVSLESKDEMFHVALYDWLLATKMSDKLLGVQSPFIESYLKQNVLLQPDQLLLLDLMWKFYEKQHNFAAAARILAKLAEKQTKDLKLHQRLEYLSRAAMCARSVTSHIATPGDGDFLHELEDKIEVARLQQQIVDCLKPNESNQSVKDALDALNSQLYDISMLYSEFADVFHLSECKLAIIYCADHHDASLVEALWQEIIDKEMSVQRIDRIARLNAVSTKFVALGRVYAASDNYFPLAFLVKYLEQCSVKFDLCTIDITFVFHSLMNIGITLARLIDVYDRLYKSKDPCWLSLGRQYHLLFVIHEMMNEFANRPTIVAAYERRSVTVTSVDTVSQYLVQLQADTTADQSTRQLMAALRSLQSRLDRLV